MTNKQHAEIWRKAAYVVSRMDPRVSIQAGGCMSYSSEQAAVWSAFSAAATALHQIAQTYEDSAEKE
jgi:hypothetical protein